MNKHTTTSGPTGFGWVRSLLAFRHHHRSARLGSALLAFAMATLLVGGTGVARAAGATINVPCDQYAADGAAKVAGFEIDGNLCLNGDAMDGTIDWDSLTYTAGDPTTGDKVLDGLGDTSGFTEGSSETKDPSGWVGGQTPNSKNDIESAWGYSQSASGGDVYAYFGFTSSSDAGGTQQVNMEFSQHQPVDNTADGTNGTGDSVDLLVPDRTPGDLLFHFGMNGSAPLDFTNVLVWTLEQVDGNPNPDWTNSCTAVTDSSPAGGWCPPTSEIPADTFQSAVSADGLFGEGSINIAQLPFFQGGCSGEYGWMQMRTTTGNSWNSAMKDYVGPLHVLTPSTCGSLTIEKYQDGTTTPTIPGAVYDVWAGTDTSVAPLYDNLTEGDAADVDPTADDGVIKLADLEPGVYTVKEVSAPSGYLMPVGAAAGACSDADPAVPTTCVTQVVHLAESTNFTMKFYDPVQWAELTAKKTARGDYDTSYAWTISKGVRFGTGAFGPTASANSLNSSEAFDWKVLIGEGAVTESNFAVSGAITISNPNDSAVMATIADSLDPSCTYYDPTDTQDPPTTELADADSQTDGFQVSVPSNGDGSGTAYRYSCVQEDRSATSNSATVSVVKADYPRTQEDLTAEGTYDAPVTDGAGNTLSPDITWTEHNGDGTKTINVTDVLKGTVTVHQGSGAPWTHTWGDHSDPTWNGTAYEHVYASSVTAAPGTCASVTNTATITETEQSAEATASHCTSIPPSPPQVSPPQQQQHPNVLPNTGGPDRWVFPAGLALLLTGATLVAGDRRRKRRS